VIVASAEEFRRLYLDRAEVSLSDDVVNIIKEGRRPSIRGCAIMDFRLASE